MAGDINVNMEFNNYIDATHIGKKTIVILNATVFLSKLVVLKNKPNNVLRGGIRFTNEHMPSRRSDARNISISSPTLNAAGYFEVGNDSLSKAWTLQKAIDGSLYGPTFIKICKCKTLSFLNQGERSSSKN